LTPHLSLKQKSGALLELLGLAFSISAVLALALAFFRGRVVGLGQLW
jgi:hypothetical protein